MQHSCYDGTVSVSYVLFVQLSLFEIPEPDWSEAEKMPIVAIKELKFDLDNSLKSEIERVKSVCDDRVSRMIAHFVLIDIIIVPFILQRDDVIITHEIFHDYGKDYVKSCKLHPDSFVQVIMQLAYTEMHDE